MVRVRASGLVALALSCVAVPAFADGRPTVPAVKIEGEIRIDGIMDEPEWAAATPITGFRLIEVREGQMPSESTEVRILYDSERIYVGIWCGNRGPGAIRSSLAPRDENLDDDQIAVHFDTYRDRRRAYIFGVNADGVQMDGILDGDEPDFSWDAVWDAEAKRVMGGWTAEMAIPVREMRFPADGGGAWGIWFRRQITKNDEVCSWPLWRQEDQGAIMLQAADLTGIHGLVGSGGLEVQPYASVTRDEQRGPRFGPSGPLGGLSRWSGDYESNAGLDLKYGLTSTLVANGTFNPDYSQVEADALQIDTNRRFALFYPEKRPFFLEGAEIFNTRLDLVYTRRIADPDAGFKITGKQGRVRVGAIAAYDAGGGSLAGTGALGHEPVSREGFVGIARTTFDIGDDSNIGLLYTDRRSRDRIDGVFTDALTPGLLPQGGANQVVALDGRWRITRPLFLESQVAWSHTRVDSSSDHQGDRIARRASFDDAGYDARLRFADGVRDVSVYQSYLGPEFRSETGFLERVDIRKSGFDSDFIARPENAWLRSWQPIFNAYVIHDHTGGIQEWYVSPMIDWEFQKSTHVHTMYVRSMERFFGNEFDLNTHILNFDNWLFRQAEVSFYTTVGDGIFYEAGPAAFKGWRENYTFEATLRPSPRMTSAVSVERSRFSRKFGGEEIFDVWVMGANTTYQFTRELFARVYPQYNADDRHLDADVLIGYVLHPGTVIYAGYNGDFDRIDGSTQGTHRTWFVKASYRFVR